MQEFIKLNKVIINNDQVTFTSDHTCYANEYRVKSFNIKHVLKRFTLLTKELKAQGVSISHKYKTRKFINDNIEAYNKATVEYNYNFESMQYMADLITTKPLPTGTSDNKELNAMYIYRNTCIKMLCRSGIISKAIEFESRISGLEQELKDGDCNYSKITF